MVMAFLALPTASDFRSFAHFGKKRPTSLFANSSAGHQMHSIPSLQGMELIRSDVSLRRPTKKLRMATLGEVERIFPSPCIWVD